MEKINRSLQERVKSVTRERDELAKNHRSYRNQLEEKLRVQRDQYI
jgi:hypothetical protein